MSPTSATGAVIAMAFLTLSACGGYDYPAQDTSSVTLAAVAFQSADSTTNAHVNIMPPDARFLGKTYAQWAGASWKWGLELPLENHPFITCERDFSAGQSGKVWYWTAPDSCPATPSSEANHIVASIPDGIALFLTIRDAEASSLEAPPFYGATEAQQRVQAKWLADHIVNPFCIIDGVALKNLPSFRFVNPQIQFTAPTPWVFGTTGGSGTSVGDGYYVMLENLSKGKHTIRYGGTFQFAAGELGDDPVELVQDITIDLTVVKH